MELATVGIKSVERIADETVFLAAPVIAYLSGRR